MTAILQKHTRLILLGAFALTMAGLVAWFTMPRQEDPEITTRGGLVIIPFPGADALTIERLVAKPVEDALEEVEAIDFVRTTIRDDVALFNITLTEATTDADAVWDDVETQLATARRSFPQGVQPTQTRWNLLDLESVLIAITGPKDPLVLEQHADDLGKALLRVKGVSRIQVSAAPGEQITITLHDARAKQLNITTGMLAQQLKSRTEIIPAGTLKIDNTSLVIDPGSDFDSLQAIASTPIRVANNQILQLKDIALVQREPKSPSQAIARFGGKRAVIVGVVPQEAINVVRWGEAVSQAIDGYRARTPGINVEVIAFQPANVKNRLDGLGLALAQGVAIVALILCLAMGLRVGLTLSLVVPLVALSSLFVFSQSGGLLQQFSIAGLVVSLGLLVDNAIVMGERIQELIDRGMPSAQAASEAVSELAWPLMTATGTTIAAFLPLLLSKGSVGEFTRGIPWLVSTTLVVSLIFAVTVTPVLSIALLRPTKRAKTKRNTRGALSKLASLPVRHPWFILLATGLAMGLILPMAKHVKKEFFPKADRPQVLLELALREGTHMDRTFAQINKIERALLNHADVDTVATFVGSSTPRFYYNLPLHPQSSQLAQVLVTLKRAETRFEMVDWARQFARRNYPGMQFVARVLEQGPPTQAPIELRVYGDDFKSLTQATQQLTEIVQRAPYTRDVRHNLPMGKPGLLVNVQDDMALWRDLTRTDIARSILAKTRGIPSGYLRDTDEAIPLYVRTGAGENSDVNLNATALNTMYQLNSVAKVQPVVRPAAIFRRDGQRVVSILAQLEPGRGFNEPLDVITAKLAKMNLPGGVRVEIGGAAEASGKANGAIGAAAPFGVVTLLFFLLLQFRSFRRTGIILLTIPLSAVGVIPGLLLWDQPFGFQSLLGVLSLAGIVVNNAIILVDTLDRYMGEDQPLDQALQRTIEDRFRPIMLTTLTTVLGLTPLLWSDSALWPPMASAMITGLLASTALTLLVVPAMCKLVFSKPAVSLHQRLIHRVSGVVAATMVLGVLVGLATPALASAPQPMTLEQVMRKARNDAPQRRALDAQQAANLAYEKLVTRAAWFPSLQLGAQLVRRTSALAISTPIGDFVQQPIWGGQVQAVLQQTVLDLRKQVGDRQQARARTAVQRHQNRYQRAQRAHKAALAFIGQRTLLAQRDALTQSIDALKQQSSRIKALLEVGRSTSTDALRVKVALADLIQQRQSLDAQIAGMQATLGHLIGGRTPILASPIQWRRYPASEPKLKSRKHAQRAALRAQLQVLSAQQESLTLDMYPTLAIEARAIHQFNSPLVDNTWGELFVGLTWTPLASGTRSAQKDVLEANKLSIRNNIRDFNNIQRMEVIRIRASWRAAQNEVKTYRQIVKSRQTILTQIQAQYQAQRAILTDVLKAQAELASAQAKLRSARLAMLAKELDLALIADLDRLL